MAVSKVILNGTTLMDVTQKTVEADKMLTGYTALKNDGTDITGSYTPPTVSLQSKTNITPTTSSQTITADQGYDGLSSVQVNGDANLLAENIKKDVSIFGITGTLEGGGGGGTATLTINPAPTSVWDITAQTDVTYNNGIELPYGELIEWGEMMGGTRASVSPADNPYTVYSWIVWVESGPITTYRMVVPSFDCTITIT